jgi:hypothetical protein
MTGTTPFRVGKWLPSDQQVLGRWLDGLIAKADARGDVPLLRRAITQRLVATLVTCVKGSDQASLKVA